MEHVLAVLDGATSPEALLAAAVDRASAWRHRSMSAAACRLVSAWPPSDAALLDGLIAETGRITVPTHP
ncbi:hypothetical protein [Catenulispora pinisilvae]|uniref:hypothetical protein n=1 Tax=Catenulispora pinisilvae TaxID=2705253 RepID=UPI00189100C5|nr:hypothetical protein [Catenulispora pinisilvae]